jgi:nitrate reductase NapE component
MPNAPTPRRRKPSLRAKLKEWFRRKDYEDNSDLFLKYLMAFVLYPILVVCVLQFCYLIYRLIIGDPVMGDPGGFVAPIIIMF